MANPYSRAVRDVLKYVVIMIHILQVTVRLSPLLKALSHRKWGPKNLYGESNNESTYKSKGISLQQYRKQAYQLLIPSQGQLYQTIDP